jgi:hypothetical protein
MANVIYYKNDMVLKYTAMRNPLTDLPINDATVTAIVKTKTGQNVAGQSWPLTLSYVAGSDGEYQGILESLLEIQIGQRVDVEITITAPGGLDGFLRLNTEVRQRGKVS